jgi:hypothetical protein
MEEVSTNNINQSCINTRGGGDECRPEVISPVEVKICDGSFWDSTGDVVRWPRERGESDQSSRILTLSSFVKSNIYH